MLKEGKFGLQEAVCLATLSIATKVFYTSPAFLVRLVGTSSWYTTIISSLTAMAGFGCAVALLKRFPNKGLVEVFELSLGRVAGFLFSAVFCVFFLREAGTLTREFADVLRTYTFNETPTAALAGAMVLTVGIAASLGLESLARLSKFAAYFILAGFLLVLLLGAREYNPSNLFPILGYGLDKTLRNGLMRSSYYGPVIFLGFIAPSLQSLTNVKKAGLITLSITGAIVASALFCTLMIFPYYTGQELTDPMYALAREIKYGYFFTRIDILFIFIWIFASAICLSALFYAAASIFCKVFRLTDIRPVILPMTLLLFALAMLPRDMSTVINKSVQGSRNISWMVYFGLPLAALVTAALRHKKDVGTNA